jgi:membrane-associated phospholipid phosphatase
MEEYGFPSTHAMFAASIPLALVLLSIQRYDVSVIKTKTKSIDIHFFIDI